MFSWVIISLVEYFLILLWCMEKFLISRYFDFNEGDIVRGSFIFLLKKLFFVLLRIYFIC